MDEIIFPLNPQMRGAKVANLQEGLRRMFEARFFQLTDADRQRIEPLLQSELAKKRYGRTTRQLVTAFQTLRRLEATGAVNEATAKELNSVLEKFEMPRPPEQGGGMRIVAGQVVREGGEPLADGLVRAFHVEDDTPLRLGEDNTDDAGHYTIHYTALPDTGQIDLRVAVFDDSGNRLAESEVRHAAKPKEFVNIEVPDTDRQAFEVEGIVGSSSSAAVAGLRVLVVDKTPGDGVELAETLTNENGSYHVRFGDEKLRARKKERPDLQARVFASDKFLGASAVHYNATNSETLNVLLDERATGALRSEHEALTGNISLHYSGELRELKETDQRQDITYLANKTGWDARAVALASLADQFSANTVQDNGDRIDPEFFYALFRVGLPADESSLYQVDPKTVEASWKRAIEHGLIPAALENALPASVERFRELSAREALEGPARVGISPLKDMLSVSIGDDPAKQQEFTEIYTRLRGDETEFWPAVREAFGEATERRLRVDGKLAFLTLNNSQLIGKLHTVAGDGGLADTRELVEGRYYRTDTWRNLIGEGPVPPEIPGEDDAEKRDRYAELLAAEVRLSYPTAVVAQMIQVGETPLANDAFGDQVHDFLIQHEGDFEIGAGPIQQYVVKNNIQIESEVIQEITRVQRVYQITTSDDAMNALLTHKVDSAYAAVQYNRDEFVAAFKNEVGGEAGARIIYARSQQVHNAVLNVAINYLTASRAPGIGVNSPGQYINPESSGAGSPDIIAYPTLENLLGEMDFCACEHCRSILSPAAYLVDLLQFLDRSVNPPGAENPQTVLLDRRPDIQHLPLTCENTLTPLPYIDLVNETLEYFVTNNLSLAGYEGYDTSDVASAELMANPRFVNAKAYHTLAGKPAVAGDPPPLLPPTPPLPFHRALEYLRRYFNRFEAPLPRVMEALRKNDDVERASASEYAWRDVLMEELRLSRDEYALLTDRRVTLQQLFGFDAAIPEADVLDEISNVKAFSQRLSISYEDVIEILRTRFVNPGSTLIPRLERTGVSFGTLKAFKDGTISDAEFEEMLAPALDPAKYGGDIKAWVLDQDNYERIMGLITVTNPDDPDKICSFDEVTFRYADPDKINDPIRPFEFIRFARFIRLWKKLGWTIEHTDKAITALYPSNQTPDDNDDVVNLQRLDAGFLTLMPRLGLVQRAMQAKEWRPNKDLLSLLACFAPIDTHGDGSLYRRMFLNGVAIEDDAFADDGYGNFLDGAEKLVDHADTLRAAFALAAQELDRIVQMLGFDGNTPLTLENISAVYRRGWLARKLRISVREFLLIAEHTVIDPFSLPDPPQLPILKFVELLDDLRALSIKPAHALFLIWNEDLGGKSAPKERDFLKFARTLRSGLSQIEANYSIKDDPDGKIAQERMAQVYGTEAAEVFFGLLNDNVVTDVSYTHITDTLEQPIIDAANDNIGYDNLRKRLFYSAGVMSDTVRDALKNVADIQQEFEDAVDALHEMTRSFFVRYPELSLLFDNYISSNLEPEEKRLALLTDLMSQLKPRRKRDYALEAVANATKTDAEITNLVLNDTAVLHAAGDSTRPAVANLIDIEASGLSAEFFFGNTATGAVDLSHASVGNLDYAPDAGNPLPANPVAANTISGIWRGHLEVPEKGFYNFHMAADAGATVTMELAGEAVALTNNGDVWSNDDPIELHAGKLHAIRLVAENVKDRLAVRWESAGRGRAIVPAENLYPSVLMERLRGAYVRFVKAASLAEELELTPAEVTHFASHADYRIGGQGWLNHLPVVGISDIATSSSLFTAFRALLDFAGIKDDLPGDDEALLAFLKDPVAHSQDPENLLYARAGWDSVSLNTMVAHFGITIDDLENSESFRRVYDAFKWVKNLEISLDRHISIVGNEPNEEDLQYFQAALRARYDEADWLDVITPVNDEMRALQRDALVAYILHHMRSDAATAHINTPEKLFEYFLMDVEMEPCMQTSRVRNALSAIQLFIDRVLMNLEAPNVVAWPKMKKQWEWMNRYRIWEANRKVFLYPENWLEPELRDDQSPFFKEVMSELLQGDITEDAAATALLNYLSKLEEVAKLEPCGMYFDENEPDEGQDDVVHVVARTAGANRKYYYRRRESGYWTPWEQIKLEIEDNPVIPVVWRDRLFIFWLRILQKSPIDAENMPITTPAYNDPLKDIKPSEVQANAKNAAKKSTRVTVQAVLCWSEYYDGKWQPTKTSDANKPTELGLFDPAGPYVFDRSALQMTTLEGSDHLRVNIVGQGSSYFHLYNTHSGPVSVEELSPTEFNEGFEQLMSFFGAPFRMLTTLSDTLLIGYYQTFMEYNPDFRALMENFIRDKTIAPEHRLRFPWTAPFFYEDNRHVFYVTTAQRMVRVPQWDGYLVIDIPRTKEFLEPWLELGRPPSDPLIRYGVDPDDPIIRDPGGGVVDPTLFKRYVSEDPNIDKMMRTTGTVSFGDKIIGPTGTLVDGLQMK